VRARQDVQALDMDPPSYLQTLGKGEIIVIFLHSYNFQKGPGDGRSFVQRCAHDKRFVSHRAFSSSDPEHCPCLSRHPRVPRIMKKLLCAWNPEETRRIHAPIQYITSLKLLVDSGIKKYGIFKYPDEQYSNPAPEKHLRFQLLCLKKYLVLQGGSEFSAISG